MANVDSVEVVRRLEARRMSYERDARKLFDNNDDVGGWAYREISRAFGEAIEIVETVTKLTAMREADEKRPSLYKRGGAK